MIWLRRAGLVVAAGLLAVLLAVGWLLLRYARWHTTSFVITNDRVIYRSGFLSKRGIEIPLERINAVHYEQTLLGRLVGSGDVVIESGGEFGQQRFVQVDAEWLRRMTESVLHGEQVAAGEISIALVDDAVIHEINRRYLNHDYPTDVISFSLQEDRQGRPVD